MVEEEKPQLELRVEGNEIKAESYANFLRVLASNSAHFITREINQETYLVIRSLRPGSIVTLFGAVCVYFVAVEETRVAMISLIRRLVAAGRVLAGVEPSEPAHDRHATAIVQEVASFLQTSGASRIEFHVHGDNANFFIMDKVQSTELMARMTKRMGGAVGDVDSEYFEDGAVRPGVMLRHLGHQRWEALVDGVWVPASGIDAHPFPDDRPRYGSGTAFYRADDPETPVGFRVGRVTSA